MTDQQYLAQSVALAVDNVGKGGGPFGAVIVRGGEVVGEGVNRVTHDLDPTAHAEVVAIRRACRTLGDFSLAGATLYASCEPCPLCLAASMWARIDRVVFSADRHDADGAGFSDLDFYELMESEPATWPMSVESARTDDAGAPFEAWKAKTDRTPY